VSFNTRALVLECLASVYRSQGDLDLEVFLVDNASADGTVEAVRESFPKTAVIANTTNDGFSRANNRAIRLSTGDYILLLNPDTVVSEDVLISMADFMDHHPDVGMVSCKLVTGDGSLDLACRRSFPSLWDGFCRATGLSSRFPKSKLLSRYNLTYLDEDETYEVEAINGAFMFTRRRAVEEVGLLDEGFFMYGEDLDWCFRFQKNQWKIMYHPAATTIHLKGGSSSKRSSRMIREMFKSTALFYRKHQFHNIGAIHKYLILLSLFTWKWATLVRNSLRAEKRTRP
jgi:GT2 family glycosyltransferase